MHDEGGCALAECFCHEAVGELTPAPRLLIGRTLVSPPVEVHGLELVNQTGLPLYLVTAYDHAAGCLTLTARVLS